MVGKWWFIHVAKFCGQSYKITKYVSHLKLKMPAGIEFVFALPLKGDIQNQVRQPKLEDLATP